MAERVLVCMQKRQKKTVASDSDSIVSSVLCASDMYLTQIIDKIMKIQLFYYTNLLNLYILEEDLEGRVHDNLYIM